MNGMQDEIRIENLEVYAYHGVFPEENEKGQPFFVNAVLYTSTREAGEADELTLSTHYGEVCHFITKWMQEYTYKLIETVAENVARETLLRFPLIKEIDLEIRKPQAPIGLPFESVSVKIHRGWHQAYLAVGSNMGNRETYIENGLKNLESKGDIRIIPFESVSVKIHRGWHQAYLAVGSNMGNRETYIENGLKNLESKGDIRIKKVSELIVTKPYGGVEQEDFLNGVLEIETLLTPLALLDRIHETEALADRKRQVHWGPRTLDLDILFFEDEIISCDRLTVPHADMQNRFFVLKPLSEIAPYKLHPVLHKSVKQLLEELPVSE